MNRKNEPIVIMILRILLGCVFIFSGLTKAIDPIANAIQFDDYFISFRMPFMQLFSMFMAICLTIVEFTLGVMMLLRIKIRLTSLFYLLFMCFFFLLTAWLALAEYLEIHHGYDFGVVKDCGCFGKAIKLSNFATFMKNVVIIIPTIIVFIYRDYIPDIRLTELGKWLLVAFFMFIAGMVQLYCYRHLPIIDFSDWKKGTNVQESYIDKQAVAETVYVYADSLGNEYRFNDAELMEKFETDPAFFDDKKDLDPEVKVISDIERAPIQGFTMEDSVSDYSANFLDTANSRPLYILFMHYLDEVDERGIQSEDLQKIIAYCQENDADFVGLTNSTDAEIAAFKKEYGIEFPIYRSDCDPVKGPFIVRDAIHANPGLIYVQNAIVKGKWAWRDFDEVLK